MTPSIPELRGLLEKATQVLEGWTGESVTPGDARLVADIIDALPSLLSALTAAEERAEKAEALVVALQADLDAEDDEANAIYQRVKKDADAAIKAAIGPCWNHLWGPGLEQLGHIVDAGMERALRAEAARDEAVGVLRSIPREPLCPVCVGPHGVCSDGWVEDEENEVWLCPECQILNRGGPPSHATDCTLDAALSAAGLSPDDREAVRKAPLLDAVLKPWGIKP